MDHRENNRFQVPIPRHRITSASGQDKKENPEPKKKEPRNCICKFGIIPGGYPECKDCPNNNG